jgi:aspartyl-tRNA(Asn)/glutamyl-tRNA(Gln) amidotransferase subunit C
MSLSKDQVKHVATLARLELTDDEIGRLAKDLGNILKHAAQLTELDTSNVPPTEHLAVVSLPLADDITRAGLTHEAALADAPRTLNGGFAVPAFVDEG